VLDGDDTYAMNPIFVGAGGSLFALNGGEELVLISKNASNPVGRGGQNVGGIPSSRGVAVAGVGDSGTTAWISIVNLEKKFLVQASLTTGNVSNLSCSTVLQHLVMVHTPLLAADA
jgi:hypothetical protein